jgi:hypothetical protein
MLKILMMLYHPIDVDVDVDVVVILTNVDFSDSNSML